jgi:hypothetical protein
LTPIDAHTARARRLPLRCARPAPTAAHRPAPCPRPAHVAPQALVSDAPHVAGFPHGSVDPVLRGGAVLVPVAVGEGAAARAGYYMLATTPAAAAALDAGAPREPPRSHRVYCFSGASFTPTGFEIEGGKARNHKWRLSLRVLLPDGRRGVTLGQWLERHGLEGAQAPRASPARAATPPAPEPRPPSAGGGGELPPPPAGAPASAAEPALLEAPGAPAPPPRAFQRADSRAPVISGTYFAGAAAAAAAAQAAARCEAPPAPPLEAAPAPPPPAAAVTQLVLLEADALFELAPLEAADADAGEALLPEAPVPPLPPPAAATADGGAFVGDADNGAAASLLPRLLPSRPDSRPGSAASAAERAALLLAPAAPPARPNFGSACGSGGISA